MCMMLFHFNLNNIRHISRFFNFKTVGQREYSEVYDVSIGLGDSSERNSIGIPRRKFPGLIGNPRKYQNFMVKDINLKLKTKIGNL